MIKSNLVGKPDRTCMTTVTLHFTMQCNTYLHIIQTLYSQRFNRYLIKYNYYSSICINDNNNNNNNDIRAAVVALRVVGAYNCGAVRFEPAQQRQQPKQPFNIYIMFTYTATMPPLLKRFVSYIIFLLCYIRIICTIFLIIYYLLEAWRDSASNVCINNNNIIYYYLHTAIHIPILLCIL